MGLDAYYPQRVRAWPTHRNLLDDVDASHVNNIQNEIHSMMITMGTMPHVYNNYDTDPETGLPVTETGEVINTEDTAFTSWFRYYDPKVKPVNHGSVAERMDNIERGKHHYAFSARASNLVISSGPVGLADRPRRIVLPKPTLANDPWELYDPSGGFVLRKAGFWALSGSVVWTLMGNTAGANNGTYQATIDAGGEFLEGMDRDQETGQDKAPILKPFLMGFFAKGTVVTLRAAQNSGRNQRLRLSRLSGILLRETIEA